MSHTVTPALFYLFEIHSNDPSQYLSTIPDDESGDDPFESVLRNRRRSSMLSTLEEVEEKSSSEMSDDAKLNHLLGLNEIQSQEEGDEDVIPSPKEGGSRKGLPTGTVEGRGTETSKAG